MKNYILSLFFIVAGAGLAGQCSASDVHVGVGVGGVGVGVGVGDPGYVHYYPATTYEYAYPDAYDDYGYYVPDYNWGTSVNWYGGWYGDHDRGYWRHDDHRNFRAGNTGHFVSHGSGFRSGGGHRR